MSTFMDFLLGKGDDKLYLDTLHLVFCPVNEHLEGQYVLLVKLFSA